MIIKIVAVVAIVALVTVVAVVALVAIGVLATTPLLPEGTRKEMPLLYTSRPGRPLNMFESMLCFA